MKKQFLQILDLNYRTNRFTSLFQKQTDFDLYTLVVALEKALKQSAWRYNNELQFRVLDRYEVLDNQEKNSIQQIIISGLLVRKEPTTQNLQKILKIYQQTQFKMNYTSEYKIFNFIGGSTNIKEIIIFSSLYYCKIWPNICKQKNNQKQFKFKPLILWYDAFIHKFALKIKFDFSVMNKRDVKTIQQKIMKKKINNQLLEAVHNKQYKKIAQLLHNGVDVESLQASKQRGENVRQLRASHIACQLGDIQLCKLLNKFNVNWEAEDSQKMSPLFYAIKSGNLQLIKFLVEEIKVNLQKQQIQKRTPFYWACTQGDMNIIKYMYSIGANINYSSELGRTALSKACYLGRSDIVQFLLNCKQIKIQTKDKKGRAPLHNATFGAKGGREGHKFGTYEKDSPQCALLLLQKNVNVDIQDNDKNTPMHIALSSQALDSIPILILHGANLKHRNKYLQTPLLVGCKFGHVAGIKILLQNYNDDLLVKDFNGLNGLLLCAKFRNTDKMNEGFEYVLEKYFEKVKTIQNPLDEIQQTFEKLIILKANEEIIKFYIKLKNQQMKLNLNLEIIKKCIENLEQEFILRVLNDTILNQEQIKQLIFVIFASGKSTIFQKFTVLYDKQLKLFDFDLKIFQNLDNVNQKFITSIITSLNLDVFRLKTQQNKNIFHILVGQGKRGTLIQLLKLYSKSYHAPIKNKYILQADSFQNKNILRQQLFTRDNQINLSCIELAIIKKHMDILKILESYINENKKNLINEHFQIDQFQIIKQDDQIRLKQYKIHQQQMNLNNLILKYQNMPDKQLLFIINQLTKQELSLKNALCQQDTNQIKQFFKKLKSHRHLYYCDSFQSTKQNLKHLNQISILSIDLEYFISKDSSQQIISTLQLSCIFSDIIIDCLKISFQKLSKLLQPLFHNQKITKVLHGCQNDLIILKSNFNLSIVNIIDTARVEMILTNKNEMVGLQNLVQKYLDIKMDKSYQIAQWRLRPLPKPMIQYARCDSMNLMILYLRLLNEVNQKNVKAIVLNNLRIGFKNRKSNLVLIKEIKAKKNQHQ